MSNETKATQRISTFFVSEVVARSLVAAFQVISDDKGQAPLAPSPIDHTAVTQLIPVISA